MTREGNPLFFCNSLFHHELSCISFGNIPGKTEWYNEGSRHSCAFTAERWGLDLMLSGCFGFVVIRENDDDTWQILEDYSMLPSNYSCGMSRFQVFHSTSLPISMV